MRSSYDGHNEFVAGLTSIQPSKLGPGTGRPRRRSYRSLPIAPPFYYPGHLSHPAFNCDMAYITIITPDFFHSQLSSLLYLLVVFGGELLVLFLLVLPSITRGLRAGGDGVEDWLPWASISKEVLRIVVSLRATAMRATSFDFPAATSLSRKLLRCGL